jgi:hypothetical protein
MRWEKKMINNKWRWGLLTLVLVAAATAAAQAPNGFGKDVAILSTTAERQPDRSRLVDALYRCALELHMQERSMPRIVLLQAGKDEARVADVRDWGHVFVESHPGSGVTVYMAWIVGEPTDADLVNIFVTILNDDFGLAMSSADIERCGRRVIARSVATTTVQTQQR